MSLGHVSCNRPRTEITTFHSKKCSKVYLLLRDRAPWSRWNRRSLSLALMQIKTPGILLILIILLAIVLCGLNSLLFPVHGFGNCIATDYGLDGRGVGVQIPVGARIFSCRLRPDRFWGPPSILSDGYRKLFPQGQIGRGVKLTTHLQLVLRSRIRGSIRPLLHTSSWRGA
jgi:hypothetical protein